MKRVGGLPYQILHEEVYSRVYVLCLVAQLCPTLCNSMDCSTPGSSVHGDSPGKNTGVDNLVQKPQLL